MGYFDDLPSVNQPSSSFADLPEKTAFERGEYTTGPSQDLPKQPSPFSVLPLSSDSEGNIQFDSRAGILGTLLAGPRLTKDAYEGNVDLNSPEGIGRALEVAGSITPMGPVRSLAGKAIAVPTKGELRASADAGYDAVRDAGVPYTSSTLQSHLNDLRSSIYNENGINERISPKSFGALNDLETTMANSPTVNIRDIEITRRQLEAAGKDPAEKVAVGRFKRGLEDYIQNPPAGAVPSDKIDAAANVASTLRQARGDYAASMRAGVLDKLASDTEIDAIRGADPARAIKTRAAQILKNEKLSSKFNEDELGALRDIVGSGGVASKAGGILGGGGLGSVTAAMQRGAAGLTLGGGIPGAVAAAATPTLGTFLKGRGADNTQKALEAANELVRRRSPMYRGLLEQAPPAMPYSEWRNLAPAVGLFGTNAFLQALHDNQ